MNKFVIIAHGRTGSKLLSKALDAHAHCLTFGELFHEDLSEREAACLDQVKPFTGAMDAPTYLSQEVYTWRQGIHAVGFTIFYEHARNGDAERSVWHYLLRKTNVTIIHLQRSQLLEAWLSYEIARHTDQWMIHADERSTPTVDQLFKVNVRELERFFDRIFAQRQWVRKAFEYHTVLQLFYEDALCNRFSSAVNQLYQQLGLHEQTVVPSLRKQTTQSPRHLIENYDELARHFSISPYARYFQDDGRPGD